MDILAIIPARGGSQGIPKKNITPLAGQPLLIYSIKAAQQSRYVNKVVVSSDSAEILAIARANNVEAIERPAAIAGSNSKMDEAINHVLVEMQKHGYKPDLIVLLQPTSPLRTAATLDQAIEAFIKNQDKFDSLIPLAETSNKIGTIEGETFKPKYPAGVQRQELQPLYYDCGTVHIFKPAIITAGGFFGENILAFPIPWPESLDVDSHEDLILAEHFLERMGK